MDAVSVPNYATNKFLELALAVCAGVQDRYSSQAPLLCGRLSRKGLEVVNALMTSRNASRARPRRAPLS